MVTLVCGTQSWRLYTTFPEVPVAVPAVPWATKAPVFVLFAATVTGAVFQWPEATVLLTTHMSYLVLLTTVPLAMQFPDMDPPFPRVARNPFYTTMV